ncbi:unnamed protein product [Triticum turgidum subsp. durum]|uniref:O-fucosyltransferase family protein n=1 Tax=Triticum turgidum subsp. durum TaxID=4567 RepID=A0A9R1NT32_TRITD|nr:unnamed protein product [Triticum turgidum subsp. durum]
MGFDDTTFLYVASGKIYNAAKYMGPLRQMFPLLQTKDTLALSEELAEFEIESIQAPHAGILHHSDIRGIAFSKHNDSIYTFPVPDCMCQQDGI